GGVCFSQIKAGSTFQSESKGFQIPPTQPICSVRIGRAYAGRHWAHCVDREGAGFAISRLDQQTEQSQSWAWGRRRYRELDITHCSTSCLANTARAATKASFKRPISAGTLPR